MTEEEAIRVVQSRRRELDIDPAMQIDGAEKAIVEYLANPDEPGEPEDRLAWIVSLSCSWGFVEVDVDDATGEVLTVRRSA